MRGFLSTKLVRHHDFRLVAVLTGIHAPVGDVWSFRYEIDPIHLGSVVEPNETRVIFQVAVYCSRDGEWLKRAGSLSSRLTPFRRFAENLGTLRQVLDKTGRPLFPGLHNAGEDSTFGYPVVVNPAMDELPTTPNSPPVAKKPVLFGDFSKYVVRRLRHS